MPPEMPQLQVTRGGSVRRDFDLSDDAGIAVIGRSDDCDICLAGDPGISRYHAAIVRAKDCSGYFVRDLGSLDPTKIGGRVVHQHLLRDGDEIEVGDYRILYGNRTRPQLKSCPLRIVDRNSEERRRDGEETTWLRRRHRALDRLTLSENERELIESLNRETLREQNLDDLLDRITPALVAATGSQRGFAGVFTHPSTLDFRVVASAGLVDGEAIEITASDCIQRVKFGQAVHEGRTLLAPIVKLRQSVGLVCLERSGTADIFSDDVTNFLMSFCELITENVSEAPGKADTVSEPQPLEWGINIVAFGRVLKEHKDTIRRAAADGRNVLVLGETGTGKGLVASAIHSESGRAGPFVQVACPEINKEVAETEVFGYVKSAALANALPDGKPSQFELANKGTLFLDEIHAFDAAMQDKLLVVLDCQGYHKRVRRVQGTKEVPVDVKVVAATDKSVESEVASGAFRAPLYHRFGVVIRLQPLRERRSDIPLLVHYFLDQWAATSGVAAVRTVSHRVLKMMTAYDWPGNVREVRNKVLVAATRAAGRLTLHSWDFDFGEPASEADRPFIPMTPERRRPKPMEEIESAQIRDALDYCKGNKTKACALLGFGSRTTLLAKMDRYSIPRDYGIER